MSKSPANPFVGLRPFESRDSAAMEKAADFVGIMLRLAEQDLVPVHVCLTMRSDFLGDCDRFAGLPEAMNRSQYLVPRLTHLNEVADICGCADAPQRVLDVLARFRQDNRNFVVLSSEKVADNPLIDISHESLIRQWPTLNQWVAAEADSAAIYRRLADTAQLHAKGKASLYRDADLEVALQWKEQNHPTAPWAARYYSGFASAMDFLEQSRRASQKKSLRRARALAFLLFLIAISACFFAWQAYNQKKHAVVQQLEASYYLAKVFEEKALSALDKARKENNSGQFQRAFLYAAEAYAQEIAPERDALESTSVGPLLGPDNIKNALACRWFSLAVDIYRGGVYDVAFSADGKTWPAALPIAPSGSGISKPINFFYHPTNPRPCCMPLPPAFVLQGRWSATAWNSSTG